jgi:phosphatidylinositol-3-phosphatase
LTASVDRPGTCEDCGAPRERGQRYCLQCGARAGLRSPQLQELFGRVRERCEAGGPVFGGDVLAGERVEAGGEPAASDKSSNPHRSTVWGGGWSLPSARVSAVLVLAFLGFGVLIGDVAASPVQSTLNASAARHVELVLPPAPSSSTSPSSSPAGETGESTSSAASEPPPASSESTPSESPTPSAPPASASHKSGSGKPSPRSRSKGGGSAGKGPPAPASGGSSSKLPPVKHVFVIMLSDQPYASVFGPSSSSPYLSQTLEHKGELLVRYYAVAHQELANAIALISGQGPTVETAANCPNYTAITPATVGAEEQVIGTGCVYPSSTKTLASQLSAKHMPWRAYIEGMGEGPDAESGGADGDCGHPALGAADPTSAATPPAGQTYATYRNPFVYFSALTGAPACIAQDVGMNELAADLAAPSRTPSFAYIVPDRCHDANPTPCAPGAPAGLQGAEPFLKRVVPEIMSSKAYKESGLLVITVDQAPSSGQLADSSSCCGQPQFPNLPPSSSGLGPEGGGQVGALLLSPFLHSGVSQEQYNHFSLLRTIEDFFELSHLGYAALPKVSSFAPSLFTAAK